jgi:GDPmannose 4,6-dehydratase
MKRILIFGGSGQDGRLLSQKLLELGHLVLCVVTRLDTTKQVVGAEYISVNCNFDDTFVSIMHEFKPTEIYNFASLSSVAACAENPNLSFKTNFELVRSIYLAARNYASSTNSNVKLIHAGSSEMFKSSSLHLNEISELEPLSTYGQHKKMAHEFLEENKGKVDNLGISNLIFFNHESYLRSEKFVSQKIAKVAAQLYLHKCTDTKFGNVSAARDWGCANDYMDAAIKVGLVYNNENYVIASGKLVSIVDLLNHSLNFVGYSSESFEFKSDESLMRLGDTPPLKGDTRKIELQVGWLPSRTIFEVLEEMIQYQIKAIRGS